jgi:2-(acetamidomethylene)succinate hydrolase
VGNSTIRRTESSPVRLAYRSTGPEGAPSVLFLHGTSANLAVWNPVISAVTEPIRAITVDQRGHGRSDHPESGYDAGDFADDTLALHSELGLGSMIMVGHSLGARNAWVFAARHPDLVSGVIAVDYTPFVETEVLDSLAARIAAGDRAFADLTAVKQYLAERYPAMPADAVERRAQFGYRAEQDGSLRPLASASALAATVNGLRRDYPDEFAGVSTELTAIRGQNSRIVSPQTWQRAQQLRPSARWVNVEEADHYVPEERPDAVAEEIDRMLRTQCSL